MQPDSPTSVRIAVLIDADNTSPKYAEALLDEIARDGVPTIRRVYGDWSSTHLGGWSRKLNPLGLQPMHQHALTTRKNSTDSAMIIDAMDLLYADNVEGFALVSSDCDFASLAMRLRAGGKFVHGMGEAKTPAGFANACDKFVQLETLGEDEAATDPADPGSVEEPEALLTINLQSALTKAVNAQSGDDGWVRLGALGQHLRRTHPSFDTRTFGHENLSSLVKEQPYLVTTGQGNDTLIQLKGKQSPRRAAKAAQPADEKKAVEKKAAKAEAQAEKAEKASAAASRRTAKTTAPATKTAKTAKTAKTTPPPVDATVPSEEEPRPAVTPTVTVTTRTRAARKLPAKDPATG